ncbi:hypothetical protein [Jeongeupia naejangsanensis]|uniref:Uncharacterized protein n=1 Tax=Jeongeupia naejangsanensis TaxID=613195 RepID=A0ABS2BNJ4_9NEIS|nr:hypothetical protein [Jeongeupia naejangsanensis]MBM3117191.1 hypothetical protein [Jeongeupia naejangsanensis]
MRTLKTLAAALALTLGLGTIAWAADEDSDHGSGLAQSNWLQKHAGPGSNSGGGMSGGMGGR